VATPHRAASEVGLAVLRQGGNAVDAAIAAAATVAVVYPHMNGAGGDNFWLIYSGRLGELLGLNAAGRSAAAVDADRYRARYGATMPTRGGAAALTVPGAVSGWWEAHRFSRDRLGSPIAWKTLLDDAIARARDGIPPSAGQRRTTAQVGALFRDDTADEVKKTFWPVFHPHRLSPERFTQPDLARTLELVAQGGAEAFYTGELAERIAHAAAAAGSPLRANDFAEHRAEWVAPLRVRYRDGEAASLPPPTQGFAVLAILALLEGFELGRLAEDDYVHLTVEATKLAFEDRDRYLADPTVVQVPVERCLDPDRLARHRHRISRRTAMPAATVSAEGDTVAIVTTDEHGNAVSLIQSLYHEFGSAVVASDTGVLLQNRGAAFSLLPAHPNCLAPRKRPAHTLIPAMYLVGGRPRLVSGTMGGDGQPQTQAALVTRIVDRGLGPQEAVEAPRWLYGRTWGEPSTSLRLEGRFEAGVAESLARRGHDIRVVDAWSDLMGHAQVIQISDGELQGGSDPRADGAALGW
jgi:gamma-glutamyltranspeptidase/glutathione hydrolase